METITPRGGGANTAQPENMAMSPEIWRYVFDTIEDPAFLHDAQFRVMLANRAYCRAAGVTEAQALGKPYWEVFPRGTGPMPGCKDAIIGKGHDGSQEEANVGGKLFFSRGYTVRDAQDKPLYALHVLSDITAQRQAEATLAGSEERSRRATETARDAIIIIDGESGAVTAWNPAVEVMFGYDKEEVIGRVLHEINYPTPFSRGGHESHGAFLNHRRRRGDRPDPGAGGPAQERDGIPHRAFPVRHADWRQMAGHRHRARHQ